MGALCTADCLVTSDVLPGDNTKGHLMFVKGWIALDLQTAANAKYEVSMATPVIRCGGRKNLVVDLMQDYI